MPEGPIRAWYEQADQLRRYAGTCLDVSGWSAERTPFCSVFTRPCLTLRRYGDAAADGRAPILIVPAPLKTASIWDIAPWASAVRRLLTSGSRVYMADWTAPGEKERAFGLYDYADRMIQECLDAIRSETAQSRAILIGHSLGGTCSALYSTLHSDRVAGLVLLGAPLHFGADVGAFGRLLALAPDKGMLTEKSGNVPGSYLNACCAAASPATFVVGRWIDWFGSLSMPESAWTHMLVARWTLDETPLPQRLFEEVMHDLYRNDRFMCDELIVGGRLASPARMKAPLLTVVDRRCRVVPPESILPFHDSVPSADRHLLCYKGDTGVCLQHVGMLVGTNAHHVLWPRIVDWIRRRQR